MLAGDGGSVTVAMASQKYRWAIDEPERVVEPRHRAGMCEATGFTMTLTCTAEPAMALGT